MIARCRTPWEPCQDARRRAVARSRVAPHERGVARKESALNLTSKRARGPVAVRGSAAVVVSGGLIATPASAAGETLNFGPAAATATIVNVDPGAHANNAGLAYGQIGRA